MMVEVITGRPAGITQGEGNDRITSYLTGKGHTGFQITGITNNELRVQVDNPDHVPAIIADIAGYTGSIPTKTEAWEENAVADAVPLIKAIAKIPRAQRNDNQKIVLGLAVMLKDTRAKIAEEDQA